MTQRVAGKFRSNAGALAFRSLREAVVVCLLYCGVCPAAHGVILEGLAGSPDYQNVWYVSDPAIPGVTGAVEPLATTPISGLVRNAGDPPIPPGHYGLEIVSVGQPFQTNLVRKPDASMGGELPPPEWADVEMVEGHPLFSAPVVVDPGAIYPKAVWIAHAHKLIAIQSGFLKVEWKKESNPAQSQEVTYLVSYVRQHTPMPIYWTHGAGSAGAPTGAPKVNLSGVPHVVVHHTPQIPYDDLGVPADPTDDLRYLWVEQAGPTKSLCAREKAGIAVLEFNTVDPPSSPEDFLGIQVVEVRKYQPDTGAVPVLQYKIGDRLLPIKEDIPKLEAKAVVTRGGTGGGEYIYQHILSGAVDEGAVFAVKKTDQAADPNPNPYLKAEVVWHRLCDADQSVRDLRIRWPYEVARYQFEWPNDSQAQWYVRGPLSHLGPSVATDATRNPHLMPYQESVSAENGGGVASLNGNMFGATGACRALLEYLPGSPQGMGGVLFQVVRCIRHDNEDFFSDYNHLYLRDIGQEIISAYHQPALSQQPGYLYVVDGPSGTPRDDVYDWEIYDGLNGVDPPQTVGVTGQIFAVNTGKLEVWWYNLDAQGVAWPSRVNQYEAKWPGAPTGEIDVADQNGSGPIDPLEFKNWELYTQNHPDRPGFNPNDEHALVLPPAGEKDKTDPIMAVFALRHDLGSADTSLPYVLVKYRDAGNKWRFNVFEVGLGDLLYTGDAGLVIQPPYPFRLPGFTYWPTSQPISGPYWRDHFGTLWAKSAGNDGGTSDIVFRLRYRVQAVTSDPLWSPNWADLPNGSEPAPSTVLPWLDPDRDDVPLDITYRVSWPEAPEMAFADVLVKAKAGITGNLPAIQGQESVEILYQQAVANSVGESVKLIDFAKSREVNLETLPGDIATDIELSSGLKVLTDLPPGLKERVRYDSLNGKLSFKGLFVDPPLGEYYVLLNVMTDTERLEMRALSTNAPYRAAVDALATACGTVVNVANSSLVFDALALTTGYSTAPGYVTLAMQNNAALTSPVSLEILKVRTDVLHAGEISVIAPECPFDERLLLKHKGDFAGEPGQYKFQWCWAVDQNGTPPAIGPGTPPQNWLFYDPSFVNGKVGAVSVLIKGPSLFALSDNWFICRYAKASDPSPNWSAWTPAQLAEGWIKRVVGEINPFTQRASGGGIQGAEDSMANYANQTVNTVVDMISQAGPRWEGNVPMNCTPTSLNDLGLIEIYQTVLNRGIDLSIDGLPPINYPPANNALLLAAGRLADLYMLLGNEAYADASDPTIAFGTDDGVYGSMATSLHCFMNMTDSLISEELALLRGRDNALQPPISTPPVYNRLVWNFTHDINGGEVAYALNYNIQDEQGQVDGQINEADAKEKYPQGHGDAWGHYLAAIKSYYKLLRHPNYTWVPRAEAVLVGGVPVTVDYLDERKFAKAAAAKAQAGSEIANLTYRYNYVADPSGQWQGYRDTNTNRAWGVAEWGSRAGMGAYLDWVAGNAILPAEDPDPGHTGIQRIDRTTVTELRDIIGAYSDIQEEIDQADAGLNPLGLATNVVPFDIDPTGIDQGKTHFEQIYERAVKAMNNAIAVFNHANNSSQLLRRQADQINAFQTTVDDREFDFRNRLIEIFGYPYPEDIGGTGAYAAGYNGPDLYHYDYTDPNELVGKDTGPTRQFQVDFKEPSVDASGGLSTTTRTIKFEISNAGFGLVKPQTWTQMRRAQGELQMARGDLIVTRIRYQQSLEEYDNLLAQIEDFAALLKAQYAVNAEEIAILNTAKDQQVSLNAAILGARGRQVDYASAAHITTVIANAGAEMLPVAVGLATDATSAARGAIRLAATAVSEAFNDSSQGAVMAELEQQQAKELVGLLTNIKLTSVRQEAGVKQMLAQMQQLVRNEITMRLDIYTQREMMMQASQRYLAALARGQRLLEERARFRMHTAANVQEYRYKDMAFRIFRNDALQKYRAQFDLAARYVYLAAKAYDYETNLLGGNTMAGRQFLADIVKARSLGHIENGIPMTGGYDPGLADPMARMWYNFDSVLRGQLGFNNPQNETTQFSLRSQLFRVKTGSASRDLWRQTLEQHIVDNILEMPEFRRLCVPFSPALPVEPGIVIPFETNINFGLNFFGWPLGGGDGAYDSSNFATKIRSVGTWFSNYNSLGSGMSATPRVYLVPVGEDIMRSPTTQQLHETRQWRILDQRLPVPFQIGPGDIGGRDWIPIAETLTDSFAGIRRFGSFRAYHDSGSFNPAETINNSRLIGRSVWNTQWLLIIPAGTLHSDREEGLMRFIHGPLVGGQRTGEGVSDIKIFFQTYAYSGGKAIDKVLGK
jgi:hypothetical protein